MSGRTRGCGEDNAAGGSLLISLTPDKANALQEINKFREYQASRMSRYENKDFIANKKLARIQNAAQV